MRHLEVLLRRGELVQGVCTTITALSHLHTVSYYSLVESGYIVRYVLLQLNI